MVSSLDQLLLLSCEQMYYFSPVIPPCIQLNPGVIIVLPSLRFHVILQTRAVRFRIVLHPLQPSHCSSKGKKSSVRCDTFELGAVN